MQGEYHCSHAHAPAPPPEPVGLAVQLQSRQQVLFWPQEAPRRRSVLWTFWPAGAAALLAPGGGCEVSHKQCLHVQCLPLAGGEAGKGGWQRYWDRLAARI